MSGDCSCNLPDALHSGSDGLHLAGGGRLRWRLDETAYDEPGPPCACCGSATPLVRYACDDHRTAVCVGCFERAVSVVRCSCAVPTAA